MLGQIDIGIHPQLAYLSDVKIQLSHLDRDGNRHFPAKVYRGDLHGSQVASIICGPFYDDALPSLKHIEAICIPRLGKTVLCLLRALDMMLASPIRVLCFPIGINLPTPVFLPFMKALKEKGALVVVPAGNKGKGTVLTPGSYPDLLTVGALSKSGNIAGYSGRNLHGHAACRKPEIFARGEFPDPARPDSGKMIRGTSMACAYVAGKAARLWEMFPEATLDEIKSKLGAHELSEASDFWGKRYIDSRLKSALRSSDAEHIMEGIVLSGRPAEGGITPFPISELLAAAQKMSGCAPLEVNYFGVQDVVHLRAPGAFFEALFEHEELYCAQAVDVSMFDM